MTRQLATVRKIAEVKDIEGADKIQAYRVDGWWVVDQKNKYGVDDLVIMCEIDSWIPYSIAPFLSRGKEPREFNGIKGERLKTIKLRGQISQGLLLPLSVLDKYDYNICEHIYADDIYSEGDEVTDELGIIKWELSEKEFIKRYQQNPEARAGGFPWYIPKSDQERIQNIKDSTLSRWKEKDLTWEVTEKLEGSSLTVYYINTDDIQDKGVCSRNINLKESEDNKYWQVVNKYNILDKLETLGMNIAIQGELIGPGILGNIYRLDDYDFYVYNIWDIDNQKWLQPEERRELCSKLELKYVPVLLCHYKPKEYDRDAFLSYAEDWSVMVNDNSPVQREGLVFKSNETNESFKAVSNTYLLGK